MFVMLPPLLQSTQVLGRSKFAWLNKLNIWNWNCSLYRSVILKSLKSAASALKNLGPRKLFVLTLPKAPSVHACPHEPADLQSESSFMGWLVDEFIGVVWNQ